MTPQPNRQLSSWIARLSADLTPEGTITRLELWHAVEGEGGERLCTIETNDRPDDEDPDDVTLELWEAAWQDATTRPQGSHQRYVVQAYRGDSHQPEECRPFTIQGSAITSLIGNGTEPPTPRGLLSQEMRQNGDMHAMMIRMAEATAGSTAQQLLEERKENDRLRAKSFEFAELREELLDRKHEREMDRLDRQRSQERIDGLLTLAQSLLPMVAAKFLGAGTPKGQMSGGAPAAPSSAGPAAANPTAAAAAAAASEPVIDDNPLSAMAGAARDKSVGTLMATLRPDQIETIFGALDPQQSIALMEIYTSFRDEAAPAAASTTPNQQPPNPEAATSLNGRQQEDNSHGHN